MKHLWFVFFLLLVLPACGSSTPDDDDTTAADDDDSSDDDDTTAADDDDSSDDDDAAGDGWGCDASLTTAEICPEGEPNPDFDWTQPYCPSFYDGVDAESGWSTIPFGRYNLPVADLTASTPFTYLELRQREDFGDATVLSSTGIVCSEASLPETCDAAFTALSSEIGFPIGAGDYYAIGYIAWNRGDEMGLITDLAGLLDHFAPIDVLAEALLVLWSQGHGWVADDPLSGGSRQLGGGFEILGRDLIWTSDVRSDVFQWSVSEDGAIEELNRAIHSVMCGAIIG
jgi:hypothetical protein